MEISEDVLEKMIRRWNRLASHSKRNIGKDTTHFEGVCKGEWLAWSGAAHELKKLLIKTK